MASGAVAGAVIGTAIGLTFLHAVDEHHKKYHKKGDTAWWDKPKKTVKRKSVKRSKSAKRK
jgi:hypothetical protein